MTVLDNVRDLIVKVSPEALCDDCIKDNLKLSVRQHASHKTRELAPVSGFDRREDACSACGKTKLVIRYA